MRRLATVAGLVAVATLLLPACAGTDRPEGIVERWLTSLNQGAAGRPSRYAPDSVSQEVLPNWRNLDPGELDVIEVGRGRTFVSLSFVEGAARVPFRVVEASGREVRATALLQRGPDGTGATIVRIEPGTAGLLLPSEGGPPIERATPAMWLAAAGAALFFALLSAALMALVSRRRRPATA